MKLFLDTNVLLRFYLRDVKKQYRETVEIINQIESGEHRAYTSAIVLLEMVYALQKLYDVPRRDVVKILESVCRLRGLTIIEETDSKAALGLYQKHNVKYADCLIASQVNSDTTIVTFDQEFTRLPVKASPPGDIR